MARRLSQAKVFFHETKGAGVVEYGLLITGIALGLITAIYAIGAQLTLVATFLGG
jgi:Flp pilus assembly pilin Flp